MTGDRTARCPLCQNCPLPHEGFTPNLTAEDRKAVLDNLQPGDCSCQRLREAEDWSLLIGEICTKSRILRLARKKAAYDTLTKLQDATESERHKHTPPGPAERLPA